jgi:hypothetical protein
LPLPAGRVAVFAPGTDRPLLVGQSSLADRAVGDDVEIVLGNAPGVRLIAAVGSDDSEWGIELTATNDQPRPATLEVILSNFGRPITADATLAERNGYPLWTVTLPANGSARLRYTP